MKYKRCMQYTTTQNKSMQISNNHTASKLNVSIQKKVCQMQVCKIQVGKIMQTVCKIQVYKMKFCKIQVCT